MKYIKEMVCEECGNLFSKRFEIELGFNKVIVCEKCLCEFSKELNLYFNEKVQKEHDCPNCNNKLEIQSDFSFKCNECGGNFEIWDLL